MIEASPKFIQFSNMDMNLQKIITICRLDQPIRLFKMIPKNNFSFVEQTQSQQQKHPSVLLQQLISNNSRLSTPYSFFCQILKHIQSINIKEIYRPIQNLKHELKPFFLQKISHINFTNLTFLYLENCQISNLQPLTWISFPNIQLISLYYNMIVSLKPLQKILFHKLVSLILDNTFTSETNLSYLNRMKVNKQKFQALQFIGAKDYTKNINIYNIFKLEGGDLFYFTIIHNAYLGQSIFQRLRHRFIGSPIPVQPETQ